MTYPLTHEQLLKADQMIGQLMRKGRTVYYVTTRNGEHRESKDGSRSELVEYLLHSLYLENLQPRGE